MGTDSPDLVDPIDIPELVDRSDPVLDILESVSVDWERFDDVIVTELRPRYRFLGPDDGVDSSGSLIGTRWNGAFLDDDVEVGVVPLLMFSLIILLSLDPSRRTLAVTSESVSGCCMIACSF